MNNIYKRLMGYENIKQQNEDLIAEKQQQQRSPLINDNHRSSVTEFSIESLLSSNNSVVHHQNHSNRSNLSPILNDGDVHDDDEDLMNDDLMDKSPSSSVILDQFESISDDNSLKQNPDNDKIVDLDRTSNNLHQQPVNLSKD
ncbi:hypothetical protein DERP_010326 [Dermatophagoides pteronyssinus]|uniref:Uncharacterized protein n=1 Tax=Dermatophagoides pteronyssinus TaxID=6956 RepID=A0ABQ8IZF3_DERPT|nr:hypothetical protein DERP_010326 [Dermatophagoides pteronyssinus]